MADFLLVPLEDPEGCFEGCIGCILILAAISLLGGGCAVAGVNTFRKKKHKK